ncbi:hypothetical protein GP2_055_00040 [Gordonia paraffinivorans NBRC 108238]|uniref:Uncharacterized protein n=1 Tax=Gordonia paraffinivorans NBRC 108238 TaxID=1223543 RepID=A0ABQ0IRH8_9ACTN|nr:hypothetical protein [Gordonia paraffinivorans]GAC86125.1 hypothetical protein GP2_055_00040 [Gordonia paraffinivorans NBRC 108238]
MSVRDLDACGVEVRAQEWIQRVAAAPAAVPIVDLYMGETWQQAKMLLADANSLGYLPEMFVASAGLGLRPVTSKGPGYSATFALGSPDSVATDYPGLLDWWHYVRAQAGAVPAEAVASDSMLVVLSDTYARVLSEEIDLWGRHSSDLLLVGGSPVQEPGVPRLPADRALRHQLGGTASSLTMRMARQWLAFCDGGALTSKSARDSWRAWAHSVRRVEVYDRAPMDDAEVVAFIRKVTQDDPTLSATRALRMLRDSGRACEQKRFSRLFAETVV